MSNTKAVNIELSWEKFTPAAATSLYLYGTLTPPDDLNERVKDAERQVTVTLDTSGVMSSTGPGRYANLSEIPFVKMLYGDISVLKKYMADRGLVDDHPYTIGELKKNAVKLGLKLGDHFNHVLQQLRLDPTSADYAARTYIYNSQIFSLSDSTVVVFNTSKNINPVLQNVSIVPQPEDFDFVGGGFFTNLGNGKLIRDIDPQAIGKTILIKYDNSLPSTIDYYRSNDFIADQKTFSSKIVSELAGLASALPAMLGVVEDLNLSKTIEYVRNNKKIVYGSIGKDVKIQTSSDSAYILVGGAGNDLLVGAGLDDVMMGGKDDDRLRGGGGVDKYLFSKDDGHDVIEDTNGEGTIVVDGTLLPSATDTNFEGVRNVKGRIVEIWSLDSGKFIYSLDALGKTLVISGSALGTSSDIKIVNIDVSKIRSSGYLGITLKNKKSVALVEGNGSNIWNQPGFDIASLAGGSSTLIEDTAKSFTIYLNQAADAGDVLTLALSGLQDKFLAVLGDTTVEANGATIKLVEGQTQVSFALVQHGELDADASVALSATYTGADASVISNSFGVDLKDTGQTTMTYNGDQRPSLKDDGVSFDWNASVYLSDGTLTNATLEEGFSDAITGSAGRDKIYGLAGNDALDGGAGADDIEGGDGDDMIGGGAGSDHISGGDGNDLIASSAMLNVGSRQRTDDTWQAPKGEQVKSQGALWGVYVETNGDGSEANAWSGADLPMGDDADYADGGNGDDAIIGSGGADQLLGGAGEDQLDGMGGGDVLEGGEGADAIQGDGLIEAGHMNSLVAALHGDDFIDGGAGNDTAYGGGGADALYGGIGSDQLWGDSAGKIADPTYVDLAYHGNDYLDGEDGDDYLEGGGGADTLYGGDGKDRLWGDTSAENLAAPGDHPSVWGNDFMDGESGDDDLVGGGGHDQLYGGEGEDKLWGDQGSVLMDGAANGNDFLDGGAGKDQLIGGGGDDTLMGAAGDDVMLGDDEVTIVSSEFHGNDYLDGGAGDDIMLGGGGNDVLFGGDGDDQLDGGVGADVLEGGAGQDTYIVDNEGDIVYDDDAPSAADSAVSATARAAVDAPTPAAAGSVDSVLASVSFGLLDNLENLTLTGDAAINGSGNALDNLIIGNQSGNLLDGGDGNDHLTGGGGDDTLLGGAGNDSLKGGEGADANVGGLGDDVYEIDSSADTVLELAGEGNDAVRTSISYALADNVEQLQAFGADSIVLTGNALENTVQGNTGNNLLTGAGGNDYLVGGAGDDVYVYQRGDGNDTIDNTDLFSDSANPGASGATDILRFGAEITDVDVLVLRSGENLVFKIKGTAEQIVVANYYAATMVSGGISSDHQIDKVEFENGVAWDQAMIATMAARAASNHAPVVTGDAPTLQTRAGASFSYALPVDLITDSDPGDALTYRVALADGSALPSWLTFDATTRTLSGKAGTADIGTLAFVLWATDDYGTSTGAALTLTVAASRPPVLSAPLDDQSAMRDAPFSYVVPDSAFVDLDQGDVLTYSATLADGGALPDWLLFDAASRSFSGLPTTLQTISVRVQASDSSSLNAFDVFDLTVQVPPVLGTADADVLTGTDDGETLRGLAGDDQLKGLGGDDTLLAGDGNDTLDGGAGADQLAGGAGDDLYLVVDAGDSVVELESQGVDSVYSSVNLVLADQVENLLLQGYANLDGAGNGLDNTLTGNAGANHLSGMAGNDVLDAGAGDDLLDGGAGDDTLAGGLGDDVYMVDEAGDSVRELAGAGDDTVHSTVDYTLPDQVENLILDAMAMKGVGNALENHLVGNQADNWLDGGTGADLLEGGTGSDSYVVDSVADRVVELAGGVDDVDRIFSSINYTVAPGDNIERVLLTGNADLTLTGDDAANRLYGNNGNNLIDGGGGGDTMDGGAGDDVYLVDTIDDTVTDDDGGNDSVRSSVSYVLSGRVENLELTGGADLDATGNDFLNLITGNSGANRLYGMVADDTLLGGAGDDLLDGGEGRDLLIGGVGNDVYAVDQSKDVIQEQDGEGVDTVHATTSYALSDNLENLMLDRLAFYASATGNAMDNQLIGNMYDNILDGGAGNDVMEGGDGTDIYIVDNAQDRVVELANNGFDTIKTAIDYTLENIANVEALQLTGNADLNATGNDDGNLLVGNSGNNRLDGGLGDDMMNGGSGDDTFFTDMQADIINESVDGGNDTEQRNFESSYHLADNVENLVLGSGLHNANGNDGDNILTGNAAANSLIGMAGNDTLLGGDGDDALFGSEGADLLVGGTGADYYSVDDVADRIVESAGEGDDLVSTTVSWTLGSDVERLQSSGGANLALTGNAQDNAIWGNAGNNQLAGAQGADYLSGGRGDDVYLFNRGDGHDTVDNLDLTSATDTLRFGAGIAESDVQASRSGNALFLTLKGGSDQIALLNYFANPTTLDGQNADAKIDKVQFDGGVQWDQAAIQALIDRAGSNHAPTIHSYLPSLNAKASSPFSYTVAADTIIDQDVWDSVSYRVSMPDGSALPSWLRFDATTRTLSGTPGTGDVGKLQFVLWGADSYNASAGEYVTLTVAAPNTLLGAPAASTTRAVVQRVGASAPDSDVGDGAGDATRAAGANADDIQPCLSVASLRDARLGASGVWLTDGWLTGAPLAYSGGVAAIDSQVHSLISAMAAFAPPPPGQTTLPQQRADLAMMIAANLH